MTKVQKCGAELLVCTLLVSTLMACASAAGSSLGLPTTAPMTALLSSASQGAQPATPEADTGSFAVPELPNKGSPEAKVSLIEFTGFH